MTDTSIETRPVHGRPITPSRGRWYPLGLDEVTIDDGLFAELQERNATAMIGHCETWVERMGWAGNFDAAVEGRLPHDRQGREFSDSEVYKLLEAMAWELARRDDPDLEARYRALVARVGAAQEPDGYLNTMFGRPGQQPRWSDLRWGHELYCVGHLVQAAVARGRTRGMDEEIVRIARSAADQVCTLFGPDGRQDVGGHPEIELALVELYRLTGEQRYLDQARLFVDRRGHGVLGDIELGASYYQDDQPVREATALRGHAVRALYLAAGAADLAVEAGDDELLGAVASQVLTTLARRTYLTGGMGAHHDGESFGDDFELPSDRAYSETCAGVGSVMTNHRLLLAGGDARHADAVERTLFNVVATSPAEDGHGFFYANTLHQRTPATEVDPDTASPRALASLRAPWFHVSCCPTNVTRTVASLGAYLASVDDAGLQVHQYAGAHIRGALTDGREVELRMRTRYPEDGRIEIEVVRAPQGDWTLGLRIPAWGQGATLTDTTGTREVGPGYAEATGLVDGDRVVLELPVRARWTVADPRVDAVRGQAAVERGPLVMCLESTDLGASVNEASVDTSRPPQDDDGEVTVPVRTRVHGPESWPFGPPDGAAAEVREHGSVRLVPYRRWGNRGPATMRVWIPIDER